MSLGVGALMGINFATGFLDGVQQSNAYKRQAVYLRQQAAVFRKNAALTRLNGAMNEDISRAQNRQYLARAGAAAAEMNMTESPTFVSALSATASALEQNVLNDRYKVESEAENYLYQARAAELNAAKFKKKSHIKIFRAVIYELTVFVISERDIVVDSMTLPFASLTTLSVVLSISSRIFFSISSATSLLSVVTVVSTVVILSS